MRFRLAFMCDESNFITELAMEEKKTLYVTPFKCVHCSDLKSSYDIAIQSVFSSDEMMDALTAVFCHISHFQKTDFGLGI